MLKRFRCVQICLKAVVVFHLERLLYSMKTTAAPETIVFWIRTGAKPFSSCAVDGSSSMYTRLFIKMLSHTPFIVGHHFKSLLCPYDVIPVAQTSETTRGIYMMTTIAACRGEHSRRCPIRKSQS